MRLLENIIHFLVPRQSNNHKAKILHTSSLMAISLLLVIWQGVIYLLPVFKPSILGYAAQISPDEVVRLTNEKRIQAGLQPLKYNSTLSSAAYAKGRDMIERDYWAHVAPDGTQPWKFFSDFGYRYLYAGENLARDFSNPYSAVEAWMNSPTHKDNLLNSKYKEIGIGVVEGDLAGIDTTIIVQFFGSGYTGYQQESVVQSSSPSPTQIPLDKPFLPETEFVLKTDNVIERVPDTKGVLISPFAITKYISILILAILIAVYFVDSAITRKRNIVRLGGRAFAHIAFLGIILIIIVILKSGKIL